MSAEKINPSSESTNTSVSTLLTSQDDNSNEFNYPAQVHISVTIFASIIAGTVLCSFLLAFITGLVLGVSCGVKHNLKQVTSINKRQVTLQNIPMDNRGPVYEEIAIDNTQTIDLEQNIAYM